MVLKIRLTPAKFQDFQYVFRLVYWGGRAREMGLRCPYVYSSGSPGPKKGSNFYDEITRLLAVKGLFAL